MAQQFKSRQKTILDDPKLKLSADPLPGARGRASLSLYAANTPNEDGNVTAYPRIDVYTNVPTDKDNGLIRARMDVSTFYHLMTMIDMLLAPDTPSPTSYTIDNCKPDFRNGNKGEEPLLETKTVIGKDKDGRFYMTVMSFDADRPKIPFYFGASFYHKLYKNGKPLTDAEISWISMKGFREAAARLYAIVAAGQYNYVPRSKDSNNNNRGSGGGGYRGGNNQGGGYKGGGSSNSSATTDDSLEDMLPFN